MSAPAEITPSPGPFSGTDARTRLLAGTVAAIDAAGFRAAAPERIAAAAGLPAPLFHRYFADTDAAALAAYDQAAAWFATQISTLSGRPEVDWPARVRAVTEAGLDLLAPRPTLLGFCAYGFPRSGAAAFARHQEEVGRLAAALRVGRADCDWAGRLPPRLEQHLVSGAISTLGRRARRGEEQLRRLGPEIAYLLLVSYLDIAAASRVAFGERPRPADPWPDR